MNNTNFGYDWRNNANNGKFEPIIDEVNEITYIKKYYNLFDSKISNFVNSDVLEQEIEQNLNSVKNNNKDLEALEFLKKNERKSKKRKLTSDVETKLEDAFKNKKIKIMIDFDKNECNCIKSIAVKGNTTIDVTSRFIKGKMVMFAKISRKSFEYDLIDVFYFPTEKVRKTYEQHDIIKCHMHLNLIDTNNCSCFFQFYL